MNKKTLILAIVLIVMIALAYLYQGPLKKWQTNLGKTKNFLVKVEVDKIDKIEITTADKTVILEKQFQKWKISDTKNFYAQPQLVDELLKNLRELQQADLELVSKDKNTKSEFKTDQNGIAVKLFEGSKITLFTVGKTGPDFISAYLSQPEVATTYAVKLNLETALTPSEWRETTIFSTAKEKITKIRFQYPNREFSLEKKDGQWTGILPSSFPVSQEKIEKILEIMSQLQATRIPEQTFAGTGLEKHLIIVQTTGEGVDNTLMVGQANKDNLYFAKTGDSDNIYLITKEQRDELDKWIWQLK